MEISLKENTIGLAGSTEKFEYKKVIDKLVKLDSNEAASFFKANGGIPREIRMNAIRSCVNEYIVIAKELTLTDEMMYRLNWYPKFTDFQLVNLFTALTISNGDKFDVGTQNHKFKKNFYQLVLQNWNQLGIPDDVFTELLNLNTKPGESFEQFNTNFDQAFYDYDYNVDGLSYEDFKTTLNKSATVVEIRALAAKYDISVPKRLRKDQFVNLVLDGIRRQGRYEDGLKEKLNKMSAIALQRYAKDNKIHASTELKKSEVVEFIMNKLEACEKVVQKPRISLDDLAENKKFTFSPTYLRDVKIESKEDDYEEVAEPVVEPKKVTPTVVDKEEEKAPEVKEEVKVTETKVEEAPKAEPAPAPQQVVTPILTAGEPIKIVVEHASDTKADSPFVPTEVAFREGYSDELVATIAKMLEQKDSRDTVEELLEDARFTSVIKLYEERINYLEKLVNELVTRPVNIYADNAIIRKQQRIVDEMNEAKANPDKEEETTTLESEKLDATVEALDADSVSELNKIKELDINPVGTSKKAEKLRKQKEKIQLAKEKNDLAVYRSRKIGRFFGWFFGIIIFLVLLYVAAVVVDANAIWTKFGPNSAKIDGILSKVPYVKQLAIWLCNLFFK